MNGITTCFVKLAVNNNENFTELKNFNQYSYCRK